MSKWCDTCHRNKFSEEWKSCDSSCPLFGRNYNEIFKKRTELYKRIMKNEMEAIDEIESLEEAKEIIKMIVSIPIIHSLVYETEHIKQDFH